MHFEGMAAEYASARPPYPAVVFDALEAAGAIGRGLRVLEVGAGSGLATAELVRRGTDVVALEPGERLAALAQATAPGAEVRVARLEDARLPDDAFDAVVAATAMHWVDLAVGLPAMHATLRPSGWLAVWRNVFGDDVPTPFRSRVYEIVAQRDRTDDAPAREERPTVAELSAGGLFEHVLTDRWHWSIDLDRDQVHRLFRTFSDWTADEAEQVARAVDELGGTVTEHYQTVLHLLRSTEDPPA
jgi:SAM-dependent methyltransferase